MMILDRQLVPALALVSAALVSGATAPRAVMPVVEPNPNVERAGVLRDGVLTVTLEAKESTWWLHGPGHSAMTIAAFSEPGKPSLMPGPLLRAPIGTELRLSIKNFLAKPLTFLAPAAMQGAAGRVDAADSIVIEPGAVGSFTTRASVAGNYLYRAVTPDGVSKFDGVAGLLAGAIVIDTTRAPSQPNDRVLVIMATEDSAAAACADTATRGPNGANPDCPGRRYVRSINGRSWPNTERIHAAVGDSLHWRVINVSNEPHPMHLHGFYFRVDSYAGDTSEAIPGFEWPARGQMVVTQLMRGLSTMSITWAPDRPGNWLFHCHLAVHTTPDSLSAQPDDPHLRDMNGLVIGHDCDRSTGRRGSWCSDTGPPPPARGGAFRPGNRRDGEEEGQT